MKYFSQNDPRWRNNKIGNSDLRLGDYGCTISCISDASSWFEDETTPESLAVHLKFTPQGKVYWSSIKEYCNFEFEWRFYSYEEIRILEALREPNKVVLLNVNKGKHWVFGLSKIPFSSYYRVSDPYPYPAVKKFIRSKEIVGGSVLVKK